MIQDARIVSLDRLLERLEEVLGSNSLLLHRFKEGLRHEDERQLTDAMSSLCLYPDDVRRVVEDTVMGWLFGAREDDISGPGLLTNGA